MSAEIERAAWSGYFKEFNQRNEHRATSLEILGDLGAQESEHGLPFSGIALEERGHDAPKLEIMLGGTTPADARHLTHTITHITHITPKHAADGRDEVLEIQDAAGSRTLLSFFALPELPPSA